MGNNITTTIDKWGIDPRKLKRSKKRKDVQSATPQQTADVHLYDSVPDEPVYARVNKKRPEDELHYAEIQVVQPRQMANRGRQRPPPLRGTEYATIDFKTAAHTQAPVSATAEAADILIPPGALQRPKPTPQRKKSSSLEGAVLV